MSQNLPIVTPIRRTRRRISLRKITQTIIAHAVLGSGAILFSLPMLWSISASLKSASEVQLQSNWIPSDPQWMNYVEVFKIQPFGLFIWNTLIITFFCVIGQTISASLVAYGFSRFRFRGRNFLFGVLLSTMLLPGQVMMIPVFMIWNHFHLVDTYVPLILPSFLGGGAFSIFLFRQFFMTIPREYDEAAMIDGCGWIRIYWEILLPLARPAVITIVLFSIIGHWEDFMGPLIYLITREKYTISLGLNLFRDLYGGAEFLHLVMAASLIQIAPVIVLFFIGQRYFMKGIVIGGLKG